MSEPLPLYKEKFEWALMPSCPRCRASGANVNLVFFGSLDKLEGSWFYRCLRCANRWRMGAEAPVAPVPTGGPEQEELDGLRPRFNSPAPNIVVAAKDSEHRPVWYLQCLPWVETTSVPPHGGAPEEGDGA